MHRALATGVAVAIFALALASSALGRGGIGDAREFKAFDVYFAGHRVLGLRLAEVDVFGDGRDAEVVAFYGKCKSLPGGGCGYELQVSNTSMCRTSPDIYFSPPNLEPINGARGGWVRTAHLYDVYTGRTAVTIFGISRKEARRVGKELRNLRRSERSEDLPRPRKRLLEGRARCQHGPGVELPR
jgi:hypothetical protein